MKTSATLASIAKALSAAQGELGDATKSSFNPGFKSKYADLAEVLQTIRPVAAKNGLSFSQGVGTSDAGATVATLLMHSSGEYIEHEITIPLTKKDAQGVGSALTYGRRYAIAAMFGIAQDDDDGNAAVAKVTKPREASMVTVDSVTKALAAATSADDLVKVTQQYVLLNPEQQAAILPAAKAARARVEAGPAK